MNHPRRIITRRPESSYAHKSMGVSGRLGGDMGLWETPFPAGWPPPEWGTCWPPLKPLASEGGGRKVSGEANSAGVSRVYPPGIHLCACGHVYCMDCTVTSFGKSDLEKHALIIGSFKTTLYLQHNCSAHSSANICYSKTNVHITNLHFEN